MHCQTIFTVGFKMQQVVTCLTSFAVFSIKSENHGMCVGGSYVIGAWQLDQSQIFLHHAMYG